MAFARPAEPGFFPLDEELALLPGSLTPRVYESLVRLSTHVPSFAKAATELAWFTQVVVSRETSRRLTEAAGAALVAYETDEAARILQEHPAPPPGPDTLVVSVDGAMIPLVHGQWTEVRTLAVGAVQPPVPGPNGPVIQTTNLSYFSRRLDSTTFTEQAISELHRRGIETARRVGAVVDGAAWCQSFLDLHHPSAVRILDFAHAAEYLSVIGQTQGPDGPLRTPAELAQLRHDLKHAGPDGVLTDLRALVAANPDLPDLATPLAYLEKRVDQLQYPQFQADGWPIGSGIVESANKLLVEDRLKGAGMHWAERHVNPMLALRTAVCNDRWDEVWIVIEHAQRRQVVVQRQERHQRRHPPTPAALPAPLPPPPPTDVDPVPASPPPSDGKPAADHPWRKPWSIRRQREQAGAA
jgi:hypothetical protein